jgi:hypothetical protein
VSIHTLDSSTGDELPPFQLDGKRRFFETYLRRVDRGKGANRVHFSWSMGDPFVIRMNRQQTLSIQCNEVVDRWPISGDMADQLDRAKACHRKISSLRYARPVSQNARMVASNFASSATALF